MVAECIDQACFANDVVELAEPSQQRKMEQANVLGLAREKSTRGANSLCALFPAKGDEARAATTISQRSFTAA
jgi:hypothetical protein